MNKVALSLVSILILAVHLNWRDFTLFHASRDAQQSAIALIFEGLTLRDTRFPDGPPTIRCYISRRTSGLQQATFDRRGFEPQRKGPKLLGRPDSNMHV